MNWEFIINIVAALLLYKTITLTSSAIFKVRLGRSEKRKAKAAKKTIKKTSAERVNDIIAKARAKAQNEWVYSYTNSTYNHRPGKLPAYPQPPEPPPIRKIKDN